MIDFQNFLYERPELYDAVFPDRTSAQYCMGAIRRHATQPPQSMLDLGCGTGSTMDVLSKDIPDCVGIDLLETMIEYGKKTRPHLDLRVSNFKHLDLKRSFDVLGCFGWAFSYLVTDKDVEMGIRTLARHAHPGTLVTIDCGNADAYLSMGELPTPITRIDVPGFQANASADLELDRETLILTRKRTWNFSNGETAEDFCRYRLHRPLDLQTRLKSVGFAILEMAGDPTGKPQGPGERTLYVTAIKQ